MMPYSPCDGDLLCQNATLHRALWSEIRKRLGHISCTSNYSSSEDNGTSVHSRAINCHEPHTRIKKEESHVRSEDHRVEC